jgi:hypothetical protein
VASLFRGKGIIGVKTHLKHLATDHLTICGIWTKEDWVLKEVAHEQAEGAVCKTCEMIAGQISRIATGPK